MRNTRPWGYVALALVCVGLAISGPAAWATPEQAPNGQGGTVPTRKPSPTFQPPTPIVTLAPTSIATAPPANPTPEPPAPPPGPTTPAGPTSAPLPGATLLPVATPLPVGTITAPSTSLPLELTVLASHALAWPGLTLQFTATVVNRGTEALGDVVVDLYLADGLVPAPLPGGAAAQWAAGNLHLAGLTLQPGQALVVPFQVTVATAVKAGAVLQVMGVAAYPGGNPVVVQTLLPLPPAELPPTGGRAG